MTLRQTPDGSSHASSEPREIGIDEFRRFFQMQVSTVMIVTAHDGIARSGLTATAVCSLTDSPPSLMLSLARASQTCNSIEGSGRFGVNILREGQNEFARRFAKHAPDGKAAEAKFHGTGPWTAGPGAIPLLSDGVASLVCDVCESHGFQTHVVFIGLIRFVRFSCDGQPLLFGFRRFCALDPAPGLTLPKEQISQP